MQKNYLSPAKKLTGYTMVELSMAIFLGLSVVGASVGGLSEVAKDKKLLSTIFQAKKIVNFAEKVRKSSGISLNNANIPAFQTAVTGTWSNADDFPTTNPFGTDAAYSYLVTADADISSVSVWVPMTINPPGVTSAVAQNATIGGSTITGTRLTVFPEILLNNSRRLTLHARSDKVALYCLRDDNGNLTSPGTCNFPE